VTASERWNTFGAGREWVRILPRVQVVVLAVDIGSDVDRNLLVKQLVFTVQLGFFALKRVISRVQVSQLVIRELVLLPNIVELELGGNCLADQITKGVQVWETCLGCMGLPFTLIDNDRHHKRLRHRNLGVRSRSSICPCISVNEQARIVDLGRLILILALRWHALREVNIPRLKVLAVLSNFVEDFVDLLDNQVLANPALQALSDLEGLNRLVDICFAHLCHDHISDGTEDLRLCEAASFAQGSLC